MNGAVLSSDAIQESAAKSDRHSAVDAGGERRWKADADRSEAPEPVRAALPDRANLLRSHGCASAEGGSSPPASRWRRAPRECRRVSLAQAPGYVQLNQYRLLEPIGQGSYGIVKLAYSEEDDTHYAMKILSKRKLMRRAGLFGRAPPKRPGPQTGPPPDPLQKVYREIAILKKLDHPNVVKLVEVLDDPAEDHLYLVFELLEGGPVLEVPSERPLAEPTARSYFRDALLGLEYLHYQRIAHRDLKPANLLLGAGRVQLADLGAGNELCAGATLGTPAFCAPEALHHPLHPARAQPADIWSLGVSLFAMVFGAVPWSAPCTAELRQKLRAEPLRFPARPPVSAPLRDLLRRMLDKNPNARATMQEIKEHPWVTEHGAAPLPSEQENCRLVEVTDEDLARVVTSIPNLCTLILIKTMLKKHSFQNPFARSRRSSRAEAAEAAPAQEEPAKEPAKAKAKASLGRAGRSLSAPGACSGPRPGSFDAALEAVQEAERAEEGPSPR